MITINITPEQRNLLSSAIEMKLASIKRAMNSDRNPRFTPIYELERKETTELGLLISQASDVTLEKKPTSK